MDYQRMEAALREASDTRTVMIGTGVLEKVEQAYRQSFGHARAIVVADSNTYRVAGRLVVERLQAAGIAQAEPIIFPGQPPLYADFENVLALEKQLRSSDTIAVAVGSGTINDLTKLASERVGRPYMVVGTAASMDGYSAFGAAITKDGFKQTMNCAAPRGVVADLEILTAAPPHMNSTGYGDLLGKISAGADWILADALEIEPIDPLPWSLVQDRLREWTGQPTALHVGDPAAIQNLFEGLIMSGVAMQISKSSRPASGSEHRFSHLWEMEALGYGQEAYPHGFKVGIGTLAALALYEQVLAYDMNRVDIEARCRTWPSRDEIAESVRQLHMIPPVAENAVAESLAKYITPDELRVRLTTLRSQWPLIHQRLTTQLLPAQTVRAMLQAAGCPTDPTEIGVSMAHLRESYTLARTIRSRYTVLDLVHETGILDECLDVMFAPGGFWATKDNT